MISEDLRKLSYMYCSSSLQVKFWILEYPCLVELVKAFMPYTLLYNSLLALWNYLLWENIIHICGLDMYSQVCLRIQLTILLHFSFFLFIYFCFYCHHVMIFLFLLSSSSIAAFGSQWVFRYACLLVCKCCFVTINGFSRSLQKSFHDSVHYKGLWNI